MRTIFRHGTDVISVIKGMTLEWTNEKIVDGDSINRYLLDEVQAGRLKTWGSSAIGGLKPIVWSAAQLEPEKDSTETVDAFLQLVKEKQNLEDLAVFADRENNVVVIAHLELSN